LKADRTINNYDNELESLMMHEKYIKRPRLSSVINNIYIPKFKAKSFASYIYAGETSENYRDYKQFSEKNFLFSD
jgi:hypothetical protein